MPCACLFHALIHISDALIGEAPQEARKLLNGIDDIYAYIGQLVDMRI